MWLQELENFEHAVYMAFDFLREEQGYPEPSIEFGRDFFVIYTNPSEATRIAVGWERSWFVPFIFLDRLDLESSTEADHFPLQDILRKVGIEVNTSEYPTCAMISRRMLPGPRELWTHWRKKKDLLKEYPPFLEEYGSTLRVNYDLIIDELHDR